MKQHRSIRKYKNKTVPEDVLQRILSAAMRASSSGNMQSYSIIVSSEPGLKSKLYKPHMEQSMIIEAPILLTFCADFHRMRQWLEISEAPINFDNFMSFMIGSIDAILASQNAALAAEAEGLGICFLGSTLANCSEIGQILGCPKHVIPVVGFTLGYPDENPALRDRLPLEAIVHREKYHDYSHDDIQKNYQEKELSGMARYKMVPELNALIEKHKAFNLAQVYTQVKYTRESHLEYSKNILNYLQEQGFMENG